MSNESRITDYGSPITHYRLPVTDYPRVSIIILNWNGWQDTIECLESLYQITYLDYDVIVVDNGSEDESIEKIREYCKGKIKVESKFFEYSDKNKPIKIIEYTREEAEAGGGKENEIGDLPSNRKLIIIKNEKNYGFAEGNNIGMRYALKALNPDYVLLLNNDTVVDRVFLTELIKVGESNEKIGIVGPKIYFYDSPKKINSAGAKINFWTGNCPPIGGYEIDTGQFNETKEVDYVSGCALLIKQEVIKKIGLLNPVYFAYTEEAEWCTRAKKAGYSVIYVHKANLWHKVSSTTRKIPRFYLYYSTRNKFLFMKKHATRIQFLLFILYFFAFKFWFSSGSFLIYHKDKKAFISFCKGVKDGVKMVCL